MALSVVSDLEKQVKNKDGNHIQYTHFTPKKKQLRETSDKNLCNFMGGPCRTQEN